LKLKLYRKTLAFILALTLAVSGISFYAFAEKNGEEESTTEAGDIFVIPEEDEEPVTEDKEAEKEKAKKTLEQQHKELKKLLEDSEKKIAEYSEDKEKQEEYMFALDERIGILNEELNILDEEVKKAERKMKRLDAQIEPLEKKLKKLRTEYNKSKEEFEGLQEDFQNTYDAYCLRLRAMYISGTSSIIVAILTSDDIAQLLSRLQMIKAVAKSDTELLKEVNAKMEEITTKQDGLNDRKTKLEAAQSELSAKKREYEKEKKSTESKKERIAENKITLAKDRAKSDELYIEYAKKHKIYTEFHDDDDEALQKLEKEIDDLINGLIDPAEATTVENPELGDPDDVDVEGTAGDLFARSDAALALGWPVPGYYRLSQAFGHVRAGRAHGGIDIPCPSGTKIVAAQKGIVIVSGWHYSYGNHVMIYHGTDKSGRKIVTNYAHNTTLLVRVGDSVRKGQTIARAGSTGNSTGPHCHFEVRINGTRVNPKNYL
jgi:murein DD-endopeptidase MepM/ murein hydrolase activator NlpD